jgi:hypothetical protein
VNAFFRISILPAFILFCAGLHAAEKQILIDFGTNTGVPESPDANGNHWNSGITGAGTFSLRDTAGKETPVTAMLVGPFETTRNAMGWTDRTEVPPWAEGVVNEALNDRLFQGQNQTGTLILTGLTPGVRYDLELAASFQAVDGNAGAAPGFVSLISGDGLNVVSPVNARADPEMNQPLVFDPFRDGYEWFVRTGAVESPHNEGWIGWYGVTPDANGRIVLTFAATGERTSRGAWNAMSIVARPEE